MGGWWSGLDRTRRRMMMATGLMFVSQFLNYQGARTVSYGMPIVGSGGGDYVPGVVAQVHHRVAGVWGWSMHPQALLLLPALAAVFGLGLRLGAWQDRWGLWVGVAALALCATFNPGSAGLGVLLGLIALGIGAWAAFSATGAGQAAPPAKS